MRERSTALQAAVGGRRTPRCASLPRPRPWWQPTRCVVVFAIPVSRAGVVHGSPCRRWEGKDSLITCSPTVHQTVTGPERAASLDREFDQRCRRAAAKIVSVAHAGVRRLAESAPALSVESRLATVDQGPTVVRAVRPNRARADRSRRAQVHQPRHHDCRHGGSCAGCCRGASPGLRPHSPLLSFYRRWAGAHGQGRAQLGVAASRCRRLSGWLRAHSFCSLWNGEPVRSGHRRLYGCVHTFVPLLRLPKVRKPAR